MNNEKLRRLCIKRDWFTAGDNGQYEKLFQLNDEGAPVQDLATVIWVCSVGWEWKDIVAAIEAEEAALSNNPDHMAIPAKEALRLWSSWDSPDIFTVTVTDRTGYPLSKQKMTGVEFMSSPLADQEIRGFGTTGRDDCGVWRHHVEIYEDVVK